MKEPEHELIAGSTGTGKSRWVEYKIAQSFKFDRPCTFIDPKGGSYWNIVWWLSHGGRKWYERYKDRILFLNPVTSGNNLLTFNAVEGVGKFDYATVDPVALTANSLTSHIRKQSAMDIGEAVRMQNIMNAAIATIVQGGYTLAELPLLFTPHYSFQGNKRVFDTYNPFVQSLMPSVTHHPTRMFWAHQWSTWTPDARREWVQSTTGRIFQFLFDDSIRSTLCTTDSSRLDFSSLVEDGKWLFVHAPSSLLHDSTIVLGNIIITSIFNACMRRHNGDDYRLILDEASYFNSGPLSEILATARGHKLWLTLVVQSLEQMDRSANGVIHERIKEEIRSNVRYVTTFHNTEDSRYLAQLMFPIRGDFVTGYNNGQEEVMPIAAEINYHQRKFQNLQKRQMVIYDKYDRAYPEVKKTPDFDFPAFNLKQAVMFEHEHLALTGTPRYQVAQELQDRYQHVADMFLAPSSLQAKRNPSPSFSIHGQEL